MPDGALTPTRGRRIAPDDVWIAVREDYLAGLSAPACCRRYGVGLTALRDRAGREGWRRADQAWPAPRPLDEDAAALHDRTGGDLDRVGFDDLTALARRRMMRAVLNGDAAEALRWRRVRDVMEVEAALEAYPLPGAAPARPSLDPDASDASDAVLLRWMEGMLDRAEAGSPVLVLSAAVDPDGSDASDGVFEKSAEA
jgi:hypothetical protein